MNHAVLTQKKSALRDLLVRMDDNEVDRLAKVLPLQAVTIVSPPETGLIMADARDCFETDFYLGEVLVTRAEVDYHGYRAQATLIGDKLKVSLIAAVLEAIFMSGEMEIVETVISVCKSAEKRISAIDKMESELIASTQVDFQSMAKEN